MLSGKVYSINVSGRRGIPKEPVASCEVRKDHGIVGDVHSGKGHKQISLLSWESMQSVQACPKAKRADGKVRLEPGIFAENITTSGIDLGELEVGDLIQIGEEVTIQMTVRGKECHTYCAIYHQIGNCIMPQEGIFGVVQRGGTIKVGDEIRVVAT